jgi:phosphoribosylformylglycinamidine synthase
MKTQIYITLKNGVLDTQGKAITNALHSLGFDNVNDVRQGKYMEIDVDAKSADEAKKQASAMCEKLLANMVIENYRVEVAA